MIECFSPSVRVVAITGHDGTMHGLIDEIITSMNSGPIVALLQSNLGSNVASQGYPSRISSHPISVIRNHISLCIRSLPNLFLMVFGPEKP
jgi:hypothetical protein